MNRMYKVIWNQAKHCYAVVSELARGRTKSPSARSALRKAVLAATAAFGIGGGGVFAHRNSVRCGTDSADNQPYSVCCL